MSEINIQFMTDEAFRQCRTSADEVAQNIIDHPSDASWLPRYLKIAPYQEKQYTIEDFELKASDDGDYSKVELENGILLYERLKKLPRYILGDMHFWAWLTFEKCYKAAQQVMKVDANTVSNWWFAKEGEGRRGVMLHVIARSFYRVEMSIEEGSESPYELTKYLFENLGCYRNLVFRNISNIPAVSRAFIRAEKEASEKYGIVIDEKTISRPLMKEVSQIGSVRLIDAMPEEEIYSIVRDKMEQIIQQSLAAK